MRLYFFVILSLLAAFDLFAGTPGQTVAIRGAVSSPTAPEAKITVFSDPLQAAGSQYLLSIGGDFRFSLDLTLANPQFGELQYGDETVGVWLEPGKGLDIAFNGLDFSRSISFSGAGGAANVFLKNFRLRFPELPQRIEAFMATAGAGEYQKFILQLAGERRKLLETDADFLAASPDFQVMFSKNENYWTGYQLLRYAFDKPLFDGNWEPLVLPNEYYDFLNRLHVSTDGLLQSPDYVSFLEKYLDFQKLVPAQKTRSTAQLAEQFLTKEPRWFFQARALAMLCRDGKTDEAASHLVRFKAECQNENLKSTLDLLLQTSRGISAGMEAPGFGLTDVNGNFVSLKDLRGKVVYLDFWATWCGRCIEEMPNVARLCQNFPPEKVAVVFVSLDKDPNAWRNHVLGNGLRGLQLWGEPLQNSLVARMYGVKALPASFLIDQNGQIVKAGSGGTSVEEISRLTECLLGGQ